MAIASTAGDPLAELDKRDLQAAVDRASADLLLARAELGAAAPGVRMLETSTEAEIVRSGANVSSAQAAESARHLRDRAAADLERAQAHDRQAVLELERADALLRSGSVPRAQFEQRENAAVGAAAQVTASRAMLAETEQRMLDQEARLSSARSARSELKTNTPDQREARRAAVRAMEARVASAAAAFEQARLNLAHADLTAPVDGVVARKMFAVGDHVILGQQLLAIAQTRNLWVTANFRETQLVAMAPGQTVEVYVDALGRDLHGIVESVGGATGAKLSVFPPENAAGNYVKVVQRVPVRIQLLPNQEGMALLRPGMSVEPKVRL